MKIAILGGSFNPIHIGHCMLADSVITDLNYDKVLFIPTNLPPHKMLNNAPSAQARFEMVKLACESNPKFVAESCELDRGGVSYTYDTLLQVLDKYSSELTEKPALIMGQEVASEFHKWHKHEEIVKISNLILARRYQNCNFIDTKQFENKQTDNYTGNYVDDSVFSNFKYEYTLLDNPVLPISSTEIRARIALGKSLQYLVPTEVFRYIKLNNLYGMTNERL
jgi:nicotinate-nucleotide adenylyltransferase